MNHAMSLHWAGLLLAALALSGIQSPAAASPKREDGARTPPATRLRPVLLVIADQQDFHYQEYDHTRRGLERYGLRVEVSATTTEPSVPHPNTGQPPGTDGVVVPDVALSEVREGDYSAIVFVGGWGSSMYQYAFNDPNFDGVVDNFYLHPPYNGDDDLEDGVVDQTKVVVNRLIGGFLARGKPVAAVCHGVTVLAWARVDGVSPLAGRRVAVPFIGSPAAFFQGRWYGDQELGQYEQVRLNGGFPNRVSGQYGDPGTAADDVVVDGRIITAENYDSAWLFGQVIAMEVIAAATSGKPLPGVGRPRPGRRVAP